MKSSCLALSFAALILLATPVLGHDPKAHADAVPASPFDAQLQPVIAVVEEFSAALQAADFPRVGELLAENVLILESGGAERSREEYLAHHAISDAAFLKEAHVQVRQRTARIEGLLAWVGTESELHATKDGKALALLSTETMILKKVDAGWRIVHIHWSSRPRKDAKPAKDESASIPHRSGAATGSAPAWMPADDRAVLENAQGAGMARAAEAHGWPGPRHVLDLADNLQLDAGQREHMHGLMAAMQASARDLGAKVIAAEAALDVELAKASPDAARIATLSEQIGRLRGRLRSIHLETHLQAAEVLTPVQRQRYLQLRGSAHHGGAAS